MTLTPEQRSIGQPCQACSSGRAAVGWSVRDLALCLTCWEDKLPLAQIGPGPIGMSENKLAQQPPHRQTTQATQTERLAPRMDTTIENSPAGDPAEEFSKRMYEHPTVETRGAVAHPEGELLPIPHALSPPSKWPHTMCGANVLVETRGIEPLTPALQRRCSAN